VQKAPDAVALPQGGSRLCALEIRPAYQKEEGKREEKSQESKKNK
jgi:hypothetical protein